MITRQTIHCITPGCGLTASLDYEGADPYGVFKHDGTPPFPHAVNDPGVESGLPDLAARLQQLSDAVDQLILDNLMGGL